MLIEQWPTSLSSAGLVGILQTYQQIDHSKSLSLGESSWGLVVQ